MSETTEKQAQGYVMRSLVCGRDDDWSVKVYQNELLVFSCNGCESQQHAEQIARDIMVRYALVERPTI